jgi:hypothetical protein
MVSGASSGAPRHHIFRSAYGLPYQKVGYSPHAT